MQPATSGAFRAALMTFVAVSFASASSGSAQSFGEAQMSAREACKKALAREELSGTMHVSRTPCDSAFLSGLPEDTRDDVASLVSPAAHPTLDDLAIATLMTDAAVRKANDQPWGYLARCDIGRRLGNADLLESCVRDVRRVAPQSDAMKQALALATERPPLGVQLFRLLLALTLSGTLAHAARTAWLARARRRRASGAVSLAAFLVIFTLSSGLAFAQAGGAIPKENLSQFKVDDTDPESSVPDAESATREPLQYGYLLQDLAAKGESRSKKGDHAGAARFYAALAKAAPTVAYPPRQLCVELEAAGDTEEAIQACRSAIIRAGSTEADYTRFVSLVLASKGPLPPDERKELEAVIKHLEDETKGDTVSTTLRCEMDVRFKDVAALEACTAKLARLAPNDPKTVSLQWALAVEKRDRGAAMTLLDRARALGVNATALAKMEQGTHAILRQRVQRFGLMIVAAALIAAGLWMGRRWLVSRRQAAV